jgi:2-amino-4-hydroxy-6-hydroxymethyldihydropteridine diphosphokinase
MVPVVVALGSNVGDSLGFLRQATSELANLLTDLKSSPIYRTVPMYVEDQPAYLNAAVSGETSLGPLALLAALKGLEERIGRLTRTRYGPREIDLDLVAYGALSYRGPRLQVPHPKTPERRFVLLPMSDLEPDRQLPGFGLVQDLLEQTQSQADDVIPIEDALLSVSGNR